jgi:ornithine decarboxylase
LLIWRKTTITHNRSLDKYFPDKNTRVIAEPGRFFVTSAFTVATNIIGKRIDDQEDKEQS